MTLKKPISLPFIPMTSIQIRGELLKTIMTAFKQDHNLETKHYPYNLIIKMANLK